MKLFGLIIWINDDPITGNVINLTNITEPRKELAAYKVGDTVTARLSGFGTPTGVIGKIGDENNKKEMQSLLNCSKQFGELVAKVKGGQTSSLPQRLTKRSASPQANKRKTGESFGYSQKKKRKQTLVDLEKAGEEQQLLEMSLLQNEAEREADTPTDVGSALSVLNNSAEPDRSMGMELHIPRVEEPVAPSPVMPAQLPVIGTQASAFSSYTLQSKVYELEQNLNQAWQHINELRSNVSWLLQQRGYLTQDYHTPLPKTSETEPGTSSAASCSTQESTTNSACCVMEQPVQVYNNYTKEQLWAYIEKAEDFGKASKLLFRKLYSEDEIRGRSLTGMAANKATPARPALEDKTKLDIVYELIQKKWPYVKPSMIRNKLGEVLKPSRNQ